MSNVTPFKPKKDHLGLDQLRAEGGPLSRLLDGLGMGDKLPPIETPKRVAEMPVTVAVPIGRDTPDECRCPCCHIFEKEAHALRCPRCALQAEVREMNAAELRRRYDSIDRDVAARKPERDAMLERAERQALADAAMLKARADQSTLVAQLDEWDVDWRLHYSTIESAEANYLRERQP